MLRILSVSYLILLFAWNLPLCHAQEIIPDLYKQLKYRHIGPQGNRVIAVAGVPGDPKIYYIGAASGGIFKTTDSGIHWESVFDDQPVSSVGSLAIALSNPNIVWAGTGETFIRSNISIGNGIYKSTDTGKTWIHMGLKKTGRIGRIVIHPKDSDIVFAAAMGHCYGPQPERGIFRTKDGGQTWERILFVDENTGCSDIAMDPNNPEILFAGMWQLEIKAWRRESGGPGSGLYMSRDGGNTWKHLTRHGLPNPPVGKIAVAVAPDNSNRVYALIETGDGIPWKGQKTDSGVLWSSDDGGENWELISYDHNLTQRPNYYTRCAVAPDDHNEVYFLAPRFIVSLDGGKTTMRGTAGGDNHDMWIDPTNGDRMVVGNDGGASISINRGQTWFKARLPIAQMYHVATDNQIPYFVYGNRQDGPSCRGPSNSLLARGGIPTGMWIGVGGAESGQAIPDPVDSNIIWTGGHESSLDRFDVRRRHRRSVSVWPDNPVGGPAVSSKYRFQWTFPIAISPHDHNKVYVGSQYVHQTTDEGNSWKIISPDLSTNDKEKQQDSGGLTFENALPAYFGSIFALAESPLEEGVIWAGTNDGLVHVTRDGGTHWTNVTTNIPDLPPWGTVSNVEPSRYDAGTCYITVDLHQVNNRDPYVYKATDYGQSWKFISSDIPRSVLSYTHCVREDPVRKGLLYLGTENALYVSFNDGGNWLPLQTNLPHAPVHWLTIQEHFNDLVVGTYGRGFWILDDITSLQQLTPQVLQSDAYLFAPRQAYRFRPISAPMARPDDQSAGENPPYGASINYYLKSATKSDVKITILDEMGQTVRILQGSKEPEINRKWWDLRYETSEQPKLRNPPIHAPWVTVGPEGWRPSVSMMAPRVSPLAAPGTYTIKLNVGGEEFNQKLIVKKDPNSAGSEADIRTQVKMTLEIRDNINSVVDMINQIEWLRKQVNDLIGLLNENESGAPVITAAKELDEKLIAIEENLIQLKLTGGSQDQLRWPLKLYSRLCKLGSSWSVDSSDFPPTTQQVAVHEMLTELKVTYQRQLSELLRTDLLAFNDLLKEEKIPNIIIVNGTT